MFELFQKAAGLPSIIWVVSDDWVRAPLERDAHLAIAVLAYYLTTFQKAAGLPSIMAGVPREQETFKGHLPRVIYH